MNINKLSVCLGLLTLVISSTLYAEDKLPAKITDPIPIVIRDHRKVGKKQFVRFAQCQIAIPLPHKTNERGLFEFADDSLRSKVDQCVDIASTEHADVLILPELSLNFKPDTRDAMITKLGIKTLESGMIIIAGTYYDEERRNRLVIIGPGWKELGYKIRPSRMEVCPANGKGMLDGLEALILQTDAGNIAAVTCVDMISDDVQYILRKLATRGDIDVIANINVNPSTWEFLTEASAIVRRHPVFASITNAVIPFDKSNPELKSCQDAKGNPLDTGYCYGNSAVFASVREKSSDAPNNRSSLIPSFPDFTKQPGNPQSLQQGYDQLAGIIPAFEESLLIYDLNLWLTREPLATNAPDQGYPTIKNIKIQSLTSKP